MSELLPYIQQPSWILFGLFAGIFLIRFFYLWVFFSRPAWYRGAKDKDQFGGPVTVVICARNEYHNLEKNLPLVLEQDYPEFQVLVVNDASDDDTIFLLKDLESKYPHLSSVNLRESVNFFKGKKLALAVGIKSARYEHLLLTDADCKPASNQWIRRMAGNFSPGKDIVLGYGAYSRYRGLLNALIRFDTMTIALQYMGLALAGRPYMGVGRNLAYRKETFYKVGGFTSHYKVLSGDDDLFINQVASRRNTRVEITPESHTLSEPKKTFKSWFLQKKRHMVTGRYYRKMDKFRLGTTAFAHFLFYPLGVLAALFHHEPWQLWAALSLILLFWVSMIIIYHYAGKKYNERKLFLYSPLFDIFLAVLNPLFAVSNIFYRKNKWK